MRFVNFIKNINNGRRILMNSRKVKNVITLFIMLIAFCSEIDFMTLF